MTKHAYANGGIITPPEGVSNSDSIPNTLGEREQVLYPDGRIARVNDPVANMNEQP